MEFLLDDLHDLMSEMHEEMQAMREEISALRREVNQLKALLNEKRPLFSTSAADYVALAERNSGAIPGAVDFDYVWGDLLADLDARGVAVTRSADPSHDQALVAQLAEIYVAEPSVFESARS